jgi:Ni/Fe-hydrogenase 1 B-type cytochrome subunit
MTESTTSMNPVTKSSHRPARFERIYVWELPVRLFHWINALCLTLLFATGLYIAHPVLVTSVEAWNHFAMGWVREVHFAAAIIFTFTFFWRGTWMIFGNRYARTGLPRFWSRRWWGDLAQVATQYLKLRTGRPHLGHTALAGLSYVLFIGVLGLAQILTGFALYAQSSPGGFWDRLVGWVVPLLGGLYNTTMWHHLFAWGFVVFAVLHIYIVLLDGQAFRNGLVSSMIDGNKFRPIGEDEARED